MSRINATSDPQSDTMHAMNSRLINNPTSSFHSAVRNSTIISTSKKGLNVSQKGPYYLQRYE
jgi:hypothetical protein